MHVCRARSGGGRSQRRLPAWRRGPQAEPGKTRRTAWLEARGPMGQWNVAVKPAGLENGAPERDCLGPQVPESCCVGGLTAHVTPEQRGQTAGRVSQRAGCRSRRPRVRRRQAAPGCWGRGSRNEAGTRLGSLAPFAETQIRVHPCVPSGASPLREGLRPEGTPPLPPHSGSASALPSTPHPAPETCPGGPEVFAGFPRSGKGHPADLCHQTGLFPSPCWQPVLVIYCCVTKIPQRLMNLQFGAQWGQLIPAPRGIRQNEGPIARTTSFLHAWQVGSSPPGTLHKAAWTVPQYGSWGQE